MQVKDPIQEEAERAHVHTLFRWLAGEDRPAAEVQALLRSFYHGFVTAGFGSDRPGSWAFHVLYKESLEPQPHREVVAQAMAPILHAALSALGEGILDGARPFVDIQVNKRYE